LTVVVAKLELSKCQDVIAISLMLMKKTAFDELVKIFLRNFKLKRIILQSFNNKHIQGGLWGQPLSFWEIQFARVPKNPQNFPVHTNKNQPPPLPSRKISGYDHDSILKFSDWEGGGVRFNVAQRLRQQLVVGETNPLIPPGYAPAAQFCAHL